jgi:hypothetical protein
MEVTGKIKVVNPEQQISAAFKKERVSCYNRRTISSTYYD